jgi:hypothetical protein
MSAGLRQHRKVYAISELRKTEMTDFFVEAGGRAYDSENDIEDDEDAGENVQYEADTLASDIRSDDNDETVGDGVTRDARPVWLPFGDDDRDIANALSDAKSSGLGGAGGAAKVQIHMLVARETMDDLIERVTARNPTAATVQWRKHSSGVYFYGAQRVTIRLQDGVLLVDARRTTEPLDEFLVRASKTEIARARGAKAMELMRTVQQQQQQQ